MQSASKLTSFRFTISNSVSLQCHEAVVEGTHPVTREEFILIQLTAPQCQMLFGNFMFKKGFVKSTL